MIEDLRAAGVPVDCLYGTYADERDVQMLRTWAVLSPHGYDGVGTFEPIRRFHPLANKVPVISESTIHDATFQLYSHWLFIFPAHTLVTEITRHYADRVSFAAAARARGDDFRASMDVESAGDAANLYLATADTAG